MEEMTLREVKKTISGLKIDELEKLDSWLREHLKLLKKDEKAKAKKKREVLKEEKRGSWTYQQIAVRCGKPGCKCNEGEPHGAYWYGYRREGRKVVSKYIGKEFKELSE